MSKGQGSQPESNPTGKIMDNLNIAIKTIINYNLLNKAGMSVSILLTKR